MDADVCGRVARPGEYGYDASCSVIEVYAYCCGSLAEDDIGAPWQEVSVAPRIWGRCMT